MATVSAGGAEVKKIPLIGGWRESLLCVAVTQPWVDAYARLGDWQIIYSGQVAAPMLRFEPFAFSDEAEVPYGGIIVTSANAVRAVQSDLAKSPLLKLPLFAVGERTAAAASAAGFAKVRSADGDATALRDLVIGAAKAKKLKKKRRILSV